MTYQETLDYLYAITPAFHQIGSSAYKPGLDRSLALATHFNHPEKAYPTIHVAGTNGKGSVSHLLAAILMEAGYRVGLYTSPHLIDFNERIRVNGKKIEESFVVDFVKQNKKIIENLQPSFFELTSTLAFEYFRAQSVDFAVIETGLGGRLDSTNIITPILSVITNISSDHTQYLGTELTEIAYEKAGIIKPGIPVVIGKAEKSVKSVFEKQAHEKESAIYFAENESILIHSEWTETNSWLFETVNYGSFCGKLQGLVQKENAQTVLCAVQQLQKTGILIPVEAVQKGFENVVKRTGLMGRWQTLQTNPLVICDTGHNAGAWEYLSDQIGMKRKNHHQIRMIVGMVSDKAIDDVLSWMPKDGIYYFTQPSNERAMPVQNFSAHAHNQGLSGRTFPTVQEAVETALKDATAEDFLFIGGSTFVVADALPLFSNENKSII